MATGGKHCLTFKVTARVGRGEQVMVCGDVPVLGAWDPEQALPLFTTPGEYPLWSSKEDVPRPPSHRAGYRYCLFRAGRFHRWETVGRPRMVAPAMVASVSAPVLRTSSGYRGGNAVSPASVAEIDTFDEDPRGVGMNASPGLEVTSANNVGGRDSQDRAQGMDLHGVGESSPPRVPLSEVDFLPRESGTSSVSVPTGLDLLESEAACPKRDSLIRSGSGRGEKVLLTSRSSEIVAEPRVPAHPPPSRVTKLETPSFVSAKAVASAAACLGSLSMSEVGDFPDKSPVSTIPEQLSQSQSRGEEDGGDYPDDIEGGVTPSSWLEEEEDEGGLGLGLRLGTESMNSPPPRLDSKSSTGLWSPRGGGVVVASFFLPVILRKVTRASNPSGAEQEGVVEEWLAEWDREQLLSLQTNLRVVRVGTIRKASHEIKDHDKPAVNRALSKLNCVPVYLEKDLVLGCYQGYCKGVLWPVMHSMMEVYSKPPSSLEDHEAVALGWQAYKQVNKIFRDKVVEVYHEGDMVWVHGFHLALLPAFLERIVKVARIGLFLHTPFPPSEIFRTLPHRTELLRGMLGADQVGFHRFVDGRHFMSGCRRLLGLQHHYSQETGRLQIVHSGKPVILTTGHAGVAPEVVRAAFANDVAQVEAKRLRDLHRGRLVLAGVEKVERLKGVWLKMLAFEHMLKTNPQLVGRVRLHEVGITNRERGADYENCRELLYNLARRINEAFGDGTVLYEEREEKDIDLPRRVALMETCAVFVKTPVHDGLSTTAMEFRLVQDLKASMSHDRGQVNHVPGVLLLSEAVSSSQALRGSLSVNPWKVEAVAQAMAKAIGAGDEDKVAWHEVDVNWCNSHTTASWAERVLRDLGTVNKEHRARYATTGLGLTSRVVGTDPSFRRLSTEEAKKAYSCSTSRVLFLDYGGTLVKDYTSSQGRTQREFEQLACLAGGSQGAGLQNNPSLARLWNDLKGPASQRQALEPGEAVLQALQGLCRDPRNLVFVVSGRSKEEIERAFGHIKGLGLAAEHGSFYRWPSLSRNGHATNGKQVPDSSEAGGESGEEWEALNPGLDNAWKAVARRFMRDFQMHTHGTYMEEKGTAMIWHYEHAEPEFGALQAKRLQDELTDVLCGSSASNTDVEGVVIGAGIGTTSPRDRGSSYYHSGEDDVRPARALSGASSSEGSAVGDPCDIEIMHEEGGSWGAGGGGLYLEVKARSASKGRFVRMVLSRLGWRESDIVSGDTSKDASRTGRRFCLCVGDDISDEEMFQALKSYGASSSAHGYQQHQHESCPKFPVDAGSLKLSGQRQSVLSWSSCAIKERAEWPGRSGPPSQSVMSVTVGRKPSDADAWLPSVDAVVSLLRTLARMSCRRDHSGLKSREMVARGPSSGSLDLLAQREEAALGRNTSREQPPLAMNCGQSCAGWAQRHAAFGGPAVGLSCVDEEVHGMNPGRASAGLFGGRASEGVRGAGFGSGGLALGIDVGQGVPVVRRHSYTMGGKPRVSLSLREFLRGVSQPEPEPPMF